MRLHLRNRRGIALVTAVLGIVVITILVVGGFFASTQEQRGGRNMLVEQRAFAVAEYGLNNEVSDWDRGRNISMDVGAIDSTRRYVAQSDTAFVKITKLNANTFWVVSEGQASMGSSSQTAARRTNAYVRIAYPSITAKAAVTTAGEIKLTGTSEIDGDNANPPGWQATGDCPPASGTLPAMLVPPGVTPDYKATNVGSTPAYEQSETAADSNTYVRYGTETWNTLAANADVKLAGGTYNWDIKPAIDADEKCTTAINNWGEPHRPGYLSGLLGVTTVVEECSNRFPIIYVDGDLHLRSNGRGQGILLINGSLELNGKFEFYGIIIARENINKGNGSAQVYGAVYARDVQLQDSFFAGTQEINYSSCAIENALRGSAVLVRVGQRHWSQMY